MGELGLAERSVAGDDGEEVVTPRWVTGMPAAAGTEMALVTPGTTSTVDAGPMACEHLLAAAAEYVRVAALQPHGVSPGRACATSSASISGWGIAWWPGRLPTSTSSAVGACSARASKRRASRS